MKIILVGCNGKMGMSISQIASDEGIEVVAGVAKSKVSYFPYPVYTHIDDVKEEADCIVDFSHYSMVRPVGKYAKKRNLPVLYGATGLNDADMEFIDHLAKNVPVLQSTNFSLGVEVLKTLVIKAKELLGDKYDIEIIEKHHNQKKDAPSGTAYMLLDSLKSKNTVECFGRHGTDAKRHENEIGVHAIRGGGLVGEHEVGFYGPYDEILITHRAMNRKVFALGALKGAKLLTTLPAGRYNIEDIIKHTLDK